MTTVPGKNIIIVRNAQEYDFGGAERFVVFLCSELKKCNYNPIVISKHSRLRNALDKQSIQTIKGPWLSWQNWSGKKALLSPIYVLWQIFLIVYYLFLFIRLKPAIIHIQGKDDFIGATIAGRMLNIKVIWTDHADLKHILKNVNVKFKNPTGKLVYWAGKFANVITLISKSEKELISANLNKSDEIKRKFLIIPNGIIDGFEKYKYQKHNGNIFCIVSRLVTDKGIIEAIKAFEKISNKNDKLVIVGDGPEEKKIKSIVRKDNVIFRGYLEDPLFEIARCDVFLHPTYHEGFGISIIEASMLNKPIIASRVGAIPEIITDGLNGILIPEQNIEALAGAMVNLINNPDLKSKLGDNARKQYLEKFQFDKIIRDEFIPLYEGKYES